MRAIKAVLHREGIGGLYKGVTAIALGAGYVDGCDIVCRIPVLLLLQSSLLVLLVLVPSTINFI